MVKRLYAAIHADGHTFVADHEEFPAGSLKASQIDYPLSMVMVHIGPAVTIEEVTDRKKYPQLSALLDFRLLRVVALTLKLKRGSPRHLALFVEVDAEPNPSTIERLRQALREPMLRKEAVMVDLMGMHR